MHTDNEHSPFGALLLRLPPCMHVVAIFIVYKTQNHAKTNHHMCVESQYSTQNYIFHTMHIDNEYSPFGALLLVVPLCMHVVAIFIVYTAHKHGKSNHH